MSVRYQILQSGGVFDFETRTIVLPDQSSDSWKAYQAWLTAGNSPLPPDTIGQDDLATSKLKRQEEIDAYAAGLRNRVVRGRSGGEMASWAIKLNEARAYTSTSDPLQAPTLSAIASIRGITLADLAGRVIANSTPYLQAEAAIDGIRGKHSDAIDAMTTVADIITYDWHSGWPVIP
jgi:hypothetical protein